MHGFKHVEARRRHARIQTWGGQEKWRGGCIRWKHQFQSLAALPCLHSGA